MTETRDPVEPITEKDTKTATAADVKRASTTLNAPAKLVAAAKGQVPVSKSVEAGDEVVRRNDVDGTLGPVADVPKPFLSEGVRADIVMHGAAVDPITGALLTRDDL